MIPRDITREHVLQAIGRIRREGVRPGRESRAYDLRYEGSAYPPKLVVSVACEIAYGRALPPDAFTGGNETNGFLERLGFTVAKRRGGVLPAADPPPAAIPTRREGLFATGLSREQSDRLTQTLLTGKLYAWSELKRQPALPPPAAGAYAWFFRSIPPGVPAKGCFKHDGMTVLYVGISPGRPGSSETLKSRIRFHYEGHAEGSTLRLTLGCLLEPELGTVLRCSGTRMVFGAAEDRLSAWMAANTAITWVEVESPWMLEEHLLQELDLPLNIDGNRSHLFCKRLQALRDKARKRAKELSNLKR